jgi:uncharacterized Zn finger protein
MNIKDFESGIEEKIVTRGHDYFSKGYMKELWSEEPHHYCAVVDGSSLYDVEIHLAADGEIDVHSCDCPYDWGEYCKHEVAVLLAIREHLATGSALKQQGEKQGFRAKLAKFSKDDLLDLMCYLAVEYDLREDIQYYLEDDGDEEYDDE